MTRESEAARIAALRQRIGLTDQSVRYIKSVVEWARNHEGIPRDGLVNVVLRELIMTYPNETGIDLLNVAEGYNLENFK